jgi:hypothetical protein
MLNVHLLYGDTGSTKTSRLGDIAEFYHAKTGKAARGIFSDTGGYRSIQSLVEEGVVVPFSLTAERGDTLIEDMDKLSRGWWPQEPANPRSKLVYGDLAGVSVILVDGLTSWCQMMMTFHEQAVKYNAPSDSISATTVRVPEMPKDSFIRSGDYIRRFTGRSDYGGVQGRIREFVRNFAMLPVETWATALESKGSDETKKPVYGPDFIGNALTGVSGPWFGNLLHLDLVPVKKQAQVGDRKFDVIEAQPYMFTRPHIDADDPLKLPYMAKARVDKRLWDKMPAVLAPDMGAFLRLVESLAEQARGMQPAMLGIK